MKISQDVNREALRLLSITGRAYILMNESAKLVASTQIEPQCTIYRIIENDNAQYTKEKISG